MAFGEDSSFPACNPQVRMAIIQTLQRFQVSGKVTSADLRREIDGVQEALRRQGEAATSVIRDLQSEVNRLRLALASQAEQCPKPVPQQQHPRALSQEEASQKETRLSSQVITSLQQEVQRLRRSQAELEARVAHDADARVHGRLEGEMPVSSSDFDEEQILEVLGRIGEGTRPCENTLESLCRGHPQWIRLLSRMFKAVQEKLSAGLVERDLLRELVEQRGQEIQHARGESRREIERMRRERDESENRSMNYQLHTKVLERKVARQREQLRKASEELKALRATGTAGVLSREPAAEESLEDLGSDAESSHAVVDSSPSKAKDTMTDCDGCSSGSSEMFTRVSLDPLSRPNAGKLEDTQSCAEDELVRALSLSHSARLMMGSSGVSASAMETPREGFGWSRVGSRTSRSPSSSESSSTTARRHRRGCSGHVTPRSVIQRPLLNGLAAYPHAKSNRGLEDARRALRSAKDHAGASVNPSKRSINGRAANASVRRS